MRVACQVARFFFAFSSTFFFLPSRFLEMSFLPSPVVIGAGASAGSTAACFFRGRELCDFTVDAARGTAQPFEAMAGDYTVKYHGGPDPFLRRPSHQVPHPLIRAPEGPMIASAAAGLIYGNGRFRLRVGTGSAAAGLNGGASSSFRHRWP